jgi:hypothetical protein
MGEQMSQELGLENLREKALIKLHELQNEIDDVENKPYKYLLSTKDGKIILSHEENNVLGECVKLSNENEALKRILKAIESGNLQL